MIAGIYAPPPNKLTPTNDIIEEALDLFRANCFSKSFDIRGPADRTLVYLLLYIGDCLGKVKPDMSPQEAQRALSTLNTSICLPGEAGFPLNGMFPGPGREAEELRTYLQALRMETANRLLTRLYADGQKVPSKWWVAFARRKFMNKSLSQ